MQSVEELTKKAQQAEVPVLDSALIPHLPVGHGLKPGDTGPPPPDRPAAQHARARS